MRLRKRLSDWQKTVVVVGPAAVILLLGALLYDSIERRRDTAREVERTQRVIASLDAFLLRLVDAETGQRGYLLTGDESFLAPYHGVARGAGRELEALEAELSRHPAQRERVERLSGLTAERLRVLEARLAAARADGGRPSRASLETGLASMEAIRTLVAEIQAGETTRLALHEREEERRAGFVTWVLLGGVFFAGGTGVLANLLLTRYAVAQEGLNRELNRTNQQLEEQAVELEMQAEELQTQAAYLEELTTELEASNDDLQSSRAELEERTADAEHANRVKADFLATMSHELRTPLNAIAGYVELLRMGIHGPVTETQERALERVKRNQEHLLTLINDILHFAKLEAGRVEVRVADVPVAEMLASLDALVEPQIRAKGLRYVPRPADEALRVRGDRDRIEQILLNLLTNAVKFTGPGGRITLSCESDGESVSIRVEDSGCGIPPEKLESIFDPFVQIRREGEPGSGQGVGLGLAISRELAEAMGGELSARSVEGEGSTFTLRLVRGQREATGNIFAAAAAPPLPEPRPAQQAGS